MSVRLRTTIHNIAAIAAIISVFASAYASAGWSAGERPDLVVGFYGFPTSFVAFPYEYAGPEYGGCYYQWQPVASSHGHWSRVVHCVPPAIAFW
jgi:hypothetical protein